MSSPSFILAILMLLSVELVLCDTSSVVDCGVPPAIEGAELSYANTTYQSLAHYKCIPGYVYPDSSNGLNSVDNYCSDNGRWYGDRIKCERSTCYGPPADISNGVRITEGYRYKDQTTYECNPGYILRGNKSSICQANNQWSPVPTCAKMQCGAPPAGKNAGIIALGDLMFGSTVTYKCYPGFQPIMGTETIVCLPSGEWTVPPECRK